MCMMPPHHSISHEGYVMKCLRTFLRTFGIVSCFGLVALTLPRPAHAGGVHVDIGIVPPIVVAPAPPVYVAPPHPVYVAPYGERDERRWRHHHHKHHHHKHHHHGEHED